MTVSIAPTLPGRGTAKCILIALTLPNRRTLKCILIYITLSITLTLPGCGTRKYTFICMTRSITPILFDHQISKYILICMIPFITLTLPCRRTINLNQPQDFIFTIYRYDSFIYLFAPSNPTLLFLTSRHSHIPLLSVTFNYSIYPSTLY